MRAAAVWFPDWPIQDVAHPGPVLIARQHAVLVCDSAARSSSVGFPFRTLISVSDIFS